MVNKDIYAEIRFAPSKHREQGLVYESIKKALEFGAKRIGHGVRCLEDSNLVNYLIEKNKSYS